MNQFELRANALRLRFKAERVRIQKDAELYIGHLNTAIGQVTLPEAKEALRAEKIRAKQALHRSMECNRLLYREQLGQLDKEMAEHYRLNPSNRTMRHIAGA
ncbi:MAG: hypothetical protein NC131_12810 [Roseburia sp.]|nr:hypothetical protein [Roseburia sp.]